MKAAGLFVFLFGLALLFFDFATTAMFLSKGLDAPRSSDGSVYPVEIKRRTIYLTRAQKIVHDWTSPSALVLIVAGALLNRRTGSTETQ